MQREERGEERGGRREEREETRRAERGEWGAGSGVRRVDRGERREEGGERREERGEELSATLLTQLKARSLYLNFRIDADSTLRICMKWMKLIQIPHVDEFTQFGRESSVKLIVAQRSAMHQSEYVERKQFKSYKIWSFVKFPMAGLIEPVNWLLPICLHRLRNCSK